MIANELWIIVSISCESCGKDVAHTLTTSKPTDEHIRKNEVRIGGGNCVDSYVSQVIANGTPVKLEVYINEEAKV